jgi:hypothetical protein
VHGVALRSSRVEPFGERFLRQVLFATMTGDVTSVRQAYLETTEALRQRAFLATEVAARVSLSKAPEVYQATRLKHSEQAYEALLTAGRTKWVPGERVRFYRAPGGVFVWVPDESEAIAFDEPESLGEEKDGHKTDKRSLSENHARDVKNRRDYDVDHYLRVLVTSYASRLRKAYASEDFEQLFRIEEQMGLFDRPIEHIQPI